MNKQEGEFIKFIPEKKEIGKNVRLKISVYRHGEKTSEGELSARGREQSREIGQKKEVPESGIKFYHSPFKRTTETVEEIIEGIKEQAKKTPIFKTRVREELAPPAWTNFAKFEEKLKEIRKKQGQSGVVKYLLGEIPENKLPLENIEDVKKWRNALALLIDREIRMAHHLYENSDVELSHITHDVVMSSFLKEAVILRDKEGKPQSVNYIEQIDGMFQPNEGFEIEIYVDEHGKESLRLLIKGREYEIDRKKIEAMAEEAKKEGYRGRTKTQNL